MIRVEHLSNHFGDLVFLKDINAEIRQGEVISIITGQIAASSPLAGTASTGPPLTVKVPASPAPSGPTHPDIKLVLAFSEKQCSLELRLDSAGPPGNLLETANLPDDLALNLNPQRCRRHRLRAGWRAQPFALAARLPPAPCAVADGAGRLPRQAEFISKEKYLQLVPVVWLSFLSLPQDSLPSYGNPGP